MATFELGLAVDHHLMICRSIDELNRVDRRHLFFCYKLFTTDRSGTISHLCRSYKHLITSTLYQFERHHHNVRYVIPNRPRRNPVFLGLVIVNIASTDIIDPHLGTLPAHHRQ